MQAEVLSVGTELLLGQTVNTDTTIVAKALSALGIDLLYAAVVGDNVGRLAKGCLRRARQKRYSHHDGRPWADGRRPDGKRPWRRLQGKKLDFARAELPAFARLLCKRRHDRKPDEAGDAAGGLHRAGKTTTALRPGCAFRTDKGKIVIMLPGPPSELTPMLHNYAVPYLEKFQSAVIASHSVHVYGRGEAPVAQMIEDLMEQSNPTVAPYAKEGEMFVRVTAKAATKEEADAMCVPVVEELKKRIGNFVYGVDVETLEELVVSEL